jgi:cell division protein FtsN
MVQDFAKIKPESVLEYRQVEAPPSWMLLFTGLITGVAVGVFGCFLYYLSGNVPPLTPESAPIAAIEEPVAEPIAQAAEEIPAGVDLEFYERLQTNEVTVDATPVDYTPEEEAAPLEIVSAPPAARAAGGIMIQSGAFQLLSSAESQKARLQALGLSNTIVKSEELNGRTLYLVQTGPYVNPEQISDTEALLV